MHEDLDDLFLKSRFGNDKGNFYKANGGTRVSVKFQCK